MKVSELEVGRYYAHTYSKNGNRAVRRIVRIHPQNVEWEGVAGTGHSHGECHVNTFRYWAQEDVTDEFLRRQKNGTAP